MTRATRAVPADLTDQDDARIVLVGVAATTNDLDTVSVFLEHLDIDTGLAFLLVLTGPELTGQKVQKLAAATPLPLCPVDGEAPIEANHVYLVQPAQSVHISANSLRSIRPPTGGNGRLDHVFQNLAQQMRTYSLAIVLGGDTSDGMSGLQAVKLEGGMTFAPSVQTEPHAFLPGQAALMGYIDLVLPAAAVASELSRLGRKSFWKTGQIRRAGDLDPDEEILPRIFPLLRRATGIDFTHYKRNTVNRRLLRRMLFHKIGDLEEYIGLLHRRPDEVQSLCDDILITVTSFFRDPLVFETVQRDILPRLIAHRGPDEPIRVWVPGCSTGEEAYSLAMLVMEFLTQHSLNVPVQFFGTDVNDRALARARAGVYAPGIVADVSKERLARFFVRQDRSYRISKAVRDLCTFARHNIIQDPPFSRLDLLSCRNVLIYMRPLLQQKIMPMFHYALKPTGFLILGASETIGRYADLFSLVDKKHRIYGKKSVFRPHVMDLDRHPTAEKGPPRTPMASSSDPYRERYDINKETDRLLLSRYAPVGAVINADFDVLQFRGRTGRYLESAPGPANLNLLKLVRPGLLFELRTALQQARTGHEAVRREAVQFKEDETIRRVTLEVIPLSPPESSERFYLVTFDDTAPAPPQAVALTADGAENPDDARVSSLLQELAVTREYLQTIIEEQEATNEELNSANEEIQSANEELQSTNEELETAKEELQSTNEELTTVNEELFERNAELSRVNNDLNNLLASVSLPILMLDPALCIRRFTPLAQKIFNVMASDVGRSIREIRPNIDIPDLEALLTDVIENLTSIERHVQHRNGSWYALRIRPYKTSDNKIDGAVVVLLDINHFVRRTQGFPSRRMVLLTDKSLQVEAANDACVKALGLADGGYRGRSVSTLLELSTDQLQSLMNQDAPMPGQRLVQLRSGTYSIDFQYVTRSERQGCYILTLEELPHEEVSPTSGSPSNP